MSIATPLSRATSGILRSVASNWAGLVINILLSLITAPIVVNSLGSVYYGIWSLLMQFTGYFWLFDFGVRESVVKYVAQYHASGERDKLASTVRTAVSLYMGVGLVALAAISALAMALPYVFNIPPDAVSTARMTAFLTGATVAQGFVFNVFIGIVMGLQQFYQLARVGILFSFLRAGLLYGLLTHGYGIVALAAIQLAMNVAYNVLVYRLCIKELPYLNVRLTWPAREQAVKLLNYGKYVLLSNVGDKIVFATDSLVIATFMPVAALTPYAIAGSLIEYLRSFVVSMASVLNPLTSSLDAQQNTRAVGTVLLAGARGAMLVGLPVCIGFVVLGETFISLWMGPQHAPTTGLILATLAAGHLLGLPYLSISGVLYGLGQHRYVAWSRLGEGAANLLLSVILVRQVGLVGVALGTAIPHVLMVVVVLPALLPRYMPLVLREYYEWTYLRPLLAGVPFAGACWLIAHHVKPTNLATFMGSVAAGLVTYVVPCWWLALRAEERRHVSAGLVRRFGTVTG